MSDFLAIWIGSPWTHTAMEITHSGRNWLSRRRVQRLPLVTILAKWSIFRTREFYLGKKLLPMHPKKRCDATSFFATLYLTSSQKKMNLTTFETHKIMNLTIGSRFRRRVVVWVKVWDVGVGISCRVWILDRLGSVRSARTSNFRRKVRFCRFDL